MNDSAHQTETPRPGIHPPSVIVTAVISIIATVVILQTQGKLKLGDDEAGYALSEYRAVLIESSGDEAYRLSPKPSNQHASCHDGYLFIQSDVNSSMQGLVIDYKNRGIRCDASLAANQGEHPDD